MELTGNWLSSGEGKLYDGKCGYIFEVELYCLIMCSCIEMKFGLKIISHIQFRRLFAYYVLAVNFVGGEDFGDCDRY